MGIYIREREIEREIDYVKQICGTILQVSKQGFFISTSNFFTIVSWEWTYKKN